MKNEKNYILKLLSTEASWSIDVRVRWVSRLDTASNESFEILSRKIVSAAPNCEGRDVLSQHGKDAMGERW